MGETGDAYAFDSRGIMLTASRFDDDLKRLGLIPNSPDATTILKLQLLDPGVDLRSGEQPSKSRANMPLTRMAAAATTEWSGYDVEGYRNYRGSKVVGAWAWLPDYGLGVAAEVETREAFQTLYILRRAFFTLFLLLVLSALVTFGFSVLVERLQSSVRKNALATRKIGQYVLLQEIGRGSSGMVYRARHAILRRPVAVKLLSPEMTNEANAVRFEHEVQMTSQLTHPNTVAIYDYGRTPEGLFYYAMEYLSGINLDRLVREFGPQPEGRVVHILRQVCGSLAEAHRIGLIHRDIKPANIVLTRRAGVCDLVKVLDFGLVKAVALGPEGLSAKAVVGTPHFISPEAVKDPEKVDARSDLYGLGAVAYWLLTGKTLFDDEDVDVLLDEHIARTPVNLSKRCALPVAADLELLVMRCLSKLPQERVQTAELLDAALACCASAGSWSTEQAEAWWRDHLGGTQIIPIPQLGER
jgi:tRNA A-37 threonylcarbamoyl transferase component Bud32